MDNKKYLEQISSEIRPVKATGGLFGLNLSPRLLKILIGAVVAAILIIITGSIAGGGDNNSERDLVDKLYLRTDNLSKTISTFNKRVKSSELRSMGTSLNAVLTETNYNLGTILKEDFGASSPSQPNREQTAADESTRIEKLNEDLENGRISGTLDRVYARDLAYEIGILISLESETSAKTKRENLISTLATSMDNLSRLYEQFDNFAAN